MTALQGKLLARITGVMAGAGRANRSPLEWALFVASRLYGALQSVHAARYDAGCVPVAAIGVPVVSVGNIAVGGTGKTPMTLYLAERLAALGRRPVIVSRGYGGRLSAAGAVVSDGRRVRLGARDGGDEPVLMAWALPGVPVVIGRDRVLAGRMAMARFAPDVVILDDAFQHRRIHRDLDLVLLDGHHPLGNGYLLPRGPLREPAHALARADAVVFTRSPAGADPARPAVPLPPIPVFRSRHQPVIRRLVGPGGSGGDPPRLGGVDVYLFSGLANNDDFRYTVGRFGCRVTGHDRFADHHPYTPRDLDAIQTHARAAGAGMIVTTDKDMARIAAYRAWRLPVAVIGVRIDLGADADAFERFVLDRLTVAPGKPRHLPTTFPG